MLNLTDMANHDQYELQEHINEFRSTWSEEEFLAWEAQYDEYCYGLMQAAQEERIAIRADLWEWFTGDPEDDGWDD